MSLIVLENVEVSFGGRIIVDSLNLRVDQGERVGLIGRNGSGKSTLMRIIAQQQEIDSGVIRRAGALRVGYLPQELDVVGGQTLLESVLSSVPGRDELESSLTQIEDALAVAEEEDEQMELATQLADLHERILHFDQNYSQHEAQAILSGLRFTAHDEQRDLSEFSGGWKMRAVMAALLFQRPDLLLLDEPTNHLDVETVAWLAEFLRRYPGSLIMICHDREFLNTQVERMVSYEPEGIRQYPGNYDAYLRMRAEELEVLDRRAVNVAREREQAERFIRRFRAQATKAKAVQSRIKQLAKMDEVQTVRSQASLKFRFPPSPRSGQHALILEKLGHSYGDLRVLDGIDLSVRRGDRVAIVGPNGAGKTTLLKIIAGELQATEGRLRLGHNVKPGYYAQHVTEQLHVNDTVLDEVWRHTAVDDVTTVRSILGTFLFTEDDIDKRIGVLSGGEKSRVALARLLVNPGNLLLMDEPTNHLDLESSEALAEALETYDGTLIFVSHNLSFVGHLARRIFHVHDHMVEEYPGTFREFLHHQRSAVDPPAAPAPAASANDEKRGAVAQASPDRKADAGPVGGKGKGQGTGTVAAEVASNKQQQRSAPAPVPDKQARMAERAASKAKQRERQALQRKVTEAEKRIAALERQQSERSGALSAPDVYANQARYNELLDGYREDGVKLEELLLRWERMQASLGELTE